LLAPDHRIPVEQNNGQVKNSASFFDKRIHLYQIGLAVLICCVSYPPKLKKFACIEQHDGTMMIDHAKRT